jgi:hypothetical protein
VTFVALLGVGPARADQLCRLDTLGGVLTQGGSVDLCGWGVETPSGRPFPDFRIEIDGRALGTVTRNLPRPDVVKALNLPSECRPGWCGRAPLAGLRTGNHLVKVIAIAADGREVRCSEREISVVPGRVQARKSPAVIGATILARLVFFLGALTVIGAPISALTARRGGLLGAPLLGLGLFGAGSELGRFLKVSPFQVGLALVVAGVLALSVLARLRIVKIRRPRLGSLVILAPTALFALVGVIPMSVHGEGAVLGAIDDATRESMIAESIRLYRWSVPSDVVGMFRMMPDQWDAGRNRMGGPYLLAGLAQALGVRSHEVHSAAILGGGCLVTLGVGWLATWLFPASRRTRLLAGGLSATCGTILATLYGQHLGSLLFAAFVLGFATCCLILRRSRTAALAGAAVLVAGILTFYTEGVAVFVATGLFGLATVQSFGRARRLCGRLLIAGFLGACLNPFALARSAELAVKLYRTPVLSSADQRMVVGDTFYFPSLQVLTGLEPYRLDGPVFLRPPLRSAWNLAGLGALVALALGARGIVKSRLRVLTCLLLPTGLALLANWWLRFPYGFAKILPLGGALASVAMAEPLERMLAGLATAWRTRGQPGSRAPFLLAVAGVALIAMRLPAAFVAVRDAVRALPAYDPAYAELSYLAQTVGRSAVIRVDGEPSLGRRQWICYFLGDNGFENDPVAVRYPGADYYRLVDLRVPQPSTTVPSIRATAFALEYQGREMSPRAGTRYP